MPQSPPAQGGTKVVVSPLRHQQKANAGHRASGPEKGEEFEPPQPPSQPREQQEPMVDDYDMDVIRTTLGQLRYEPLPPPEELRAFLASREREGSSSSTSREGTKPVVGSAVTATADAERRAAVASADISPINEVMGEDLQHHYGHPMQQRGGQKRSPFPLRQPHGEPAIASQQGSNNKAPLHDGSFLDYSDERLPPPAPAGGGGGVYDDSETTTLTGGSVGGDDDGLLLDHTDNELKQVVGAGGGAGAGIPLPPRASAAAGTSGLYNLPSFAPPSSSIPSAERSAEQTGERPRSAHQEEFNIRPPPAEDRFLFDEEDGGTASNSSSFDDDFFLEEVQRRAKEQGFGTTTELQQSGVGVPHWRKAEAEAFERRRKRVLREYGLVTGDHDLSQLRTDLSLHSGSSLQGARAAPPAPSSRWRADIGDDDFEDNFGFDNDPATRAARERNRQREASKGGASEQVSSRPQASYFYDPVVDRAPTGRLSTKYSYPQNQEYSLSRPPGTHGASGLVGKFQRPPVEERFSCSKLVWNQRLPPTVAHTVLWNQSLTAPIKTGSNASALQRSAAKSRTHRSAGVGFDWSTHPHTAALEEAQRWEEQERLRQYARSTGCLLHCPHSGGVRAATKQRGASSMSRTQQHPSKRSAQQFPKHDPVSRGAKVREQWKASADRLTKESRQAVWEYRCLFHSPTEEE